MRLLLRILILSSAFIGCSSPKEKPTDCKRFRTGIFYNMRNNEVDTKITRTNDFQVEEYMPLKAICKLKVEWIDDCTYKLIYHSGNEKCINVEKESVIVEIIEVKENSYVVEAKGESGFIKFKSELFVGK